MNDSTIISCSNLCKNYNEGKIVTEVLKNINFSLEENALTAIIGSSGSGKSTLLHLLSGLDTPSSGDVFFKGQDLQKLSADEKAKLRNKHLGFIYQFHHLLPDFSALENVAMPLLIGNQKTVLAKKTALEMLEAVSLGNRATHRPSELSGGERQRVAIARALVNSPDLVLADEPTGNLDRKNAEIIFDLLIHLNKEKGTSFLVVTHDTYLVQQFNQRFVMQDGYLQQQEL